jgi:hypothetical protein
MKPPAQLALLARSLARIRWVCPGSIVKQYQLKRRNGQAQRYGPYLIWTRKVQNKTVTVALSQQQARVLARAIANRRTLEKLLRKMETISVEAMLRLPQIPRT